MPQRSSRSDLRLVTLAKKPFWRCLPQAFLSTVLEAGPSFTQERRYSVRGEFSALYFSASKELCLKEVWGRTGPDGEVMACVEFEVTVDRLVDLTDQETRRRVRAQLDDLIRPRLSRHAYATPQRVARRIYLGGFPGLLAPSVHDPRGEREDGFSLVLYPANLIRSSVRQVRVEEVVSTLPR